MKFTFALLVAFFSSISAFALPLAGDFISAGSLTYKNGALVNREELVVKCTAADLATDTYSFERIYTNADGTQETQSWSELGAEIQEFENSKNVKMQNCVADGGQLENLTIESGQVIPTCRFEYQSSRIDQTIEHHAGAPLASEVRVESIRTVGGTETKTINVVTDFNWH